MCPVKGKFRNKKPRSGRFRFEMPMWPISLLNPYRAYLMAPGD